MDKLHFDRTDYLLSCCEEHGTASELLEVGHLSCREVKPDKAIIVYFHTMVTANRAGKEALKQLLDKLPVSQADIRADHARLPRERFM